MHRLRALTVGVAAAAALAAAGPGTSAAALPKPVPSLQPQATARLWATLAARPRTLASRSAPAACRPLRAVFYVPTDWLRLATKLAAAGAPCAQYFISIPPLAADKTAFRSDQPWRIRALGPNMHALAEISTQGWGNWVASTGSTWYEAGREARRRMAAAGFDVASGDGWIVNELSSAVVRGVGDARANIRDLVRGLYDGDGGPPVRGGVFVYGMAQGTANLATWKAYLQDWYRDAPFWNDMSRYVDDWAQELYGDVRAYAVDGSSLDARRDALDAYLQHELTLVDAGPDEIAPARTFLRSAYSPLANAAWQYDSGFGWTAVPYDQMQDYVSAQTYALRAFAARTGEATDHFGFAWAPRAPAGMSAADFAAQSGAVADRLAAAIALSAESPDGACAPTWCSATVAGGAFNPAWGTFATWSPDTLALAGATSATAGAAVALQAQLQVAGIAWPEPTPVTVTLTTTSPGGGFAATPSGPWAPTLQVTVPAGATAVGFSYRDTTAGTATVAAAAPGRIGASQAVRVDPAALATLAVSPAAVTLAPGATQQFVATGADAYGNPVAVSPTWTVDAGTPGTISPGGVFTAGPSAGTGSVVASAGGVTARAAVAVNAPVLLAQTIAFAALPDRTFGDPDFVVAATASSGLPVAFAATGACTVTDTTVHLTGAGSCTVTASQPGNAAYAAAPSVSRTFTVAQATQTISFAPLPNRRLGDRDFVVVASASSNLPVSFRAKGACTVAGTRVHLVRAGSCTITASQAGNANYAAAPRVSRTFAVAARRLAVRCTVPNVRGSTLARARRAIARRHCRTGAVRYAFSRAAQRGRVVAQTPRAGRVVARGTRVVLTVGRGLKR